MKSSAPAALTDAGSVFAFSAMRIIAAANASSVSRGSVSVGLDHQRLGDDEREVHRRRVEPFVDERLSDVERGHADLLLPRGGQNELVHARAIERDVVRIAELGEEIVRGEDRVVRCLGEAFFAKRSHVRVRADEDAEVPEKSSHASYRIAEAGRLLIVARRVEVIAALVVTHDPWFREERAQGLLHTQRARAGAPRAVWSRERLVHVDVDTVEAEIAGTRDTEQRVHVRAVPVHQTADGVDRVADLAQTLLEEAHACWASSA